MAVLSGDHAQVYVDGYDLAADSNRITINDSVATHDVTAFNDQVHKFVLGNRLVTLDHVGYMEAAAARSHPVLKDVSVNGVVSVVAGQNAAPTTGDPMYSLLSQQSKYSVMSQMGSYVPFAALFANRGDAGGWGTALAVGTSFTNTVSGTVLNNGAQTSNGGAAFLHILTAAATDRYSIIIQGSTVVGFTSPVTLATFTLNASTIGSQRIALTGTVHQYVRFFASRISGTAGNTVKIAINLVRF